jgi:hypothetical protein
MAARIGHLICAGLLVVATQAFSQDVPEHPANRQDAETKGLARASIAEIKAFIPGTIQLRGHKEVAKTKIFKPDGTLEVDDARDKGGTWNFSKEHGGYCNAIVRAKDNRTVKNCFVVFKAGDGVHYFDYDAKSGHYAATWRPAPKQ